MAPEWRRKSHAVSSEVKKGYLVFFYESGKEEAAKDMIKKRKNRRKKSKAKHAQKINDGLRN